MAHRKPSRLKHYRFWGPGLIILAALVLVAISVLLANRLVSERTANDRQSALARLLGAASSPSRLYSHFFGGNTTDVKQRSSKVVVASTVKHDATAADWLIDMLPEWSPVIFAVDAGGEDVYEAADLRGKSTIAENKGREASVYLTYIINHYNDLPDYMVFIHGKRYQTHNDDPMYDTYPLIKNLNLDYVSQEGYTALRCNWKSCPAAYVEPLLGFHDGFWDVRGLYASAFQEFFPNTTIPDSVSSPCCAQFAVTRETVRRWPVEKYEQIRQYIWNVDTPDLSMKMGIVLEYMWHIIFGKPAYFCEPAKPCYCGKWNVCDLDCPQDGWCHGRIWMRDSPSRFPDDWPDKGQDGIEWPFWGWWEDPELAQSH